MIKYRLRCGKGHEYDSMFNSGSAFDKLQEARQLKCEVCGDRRIEKGIMAPAVRSSEKATRISQMDSVQAVEVLVVSDVGNIGDCVKAADAGDREAQEALKGMITGVVDEEDMPMLEERGTFITPPEFEDSKVIEHDPSEAKPSARKARRPSASPKADTKSKPGKKAVKKNLN